MRGDAFLRGAFQHSSPPLPTLNLLIQAVYLQLPFVRFWRGWSVMLFSFSASNNKGKERFTNMKQIRPSRSLAYFLATALTVASFASTTIRAAEAVATTVTAVGKKNSQPPPVKKEDIELYQG